MIALVLAFLSVLFPWAHVGLSEEKLCPYNLLTIFSDGFIAAVWLLVLLYLCYRAGGFKLR